eukprot:jgi/Tetstr1/454033/TSEL_040952.t1
MRASTRTWYSLILFGSGVALLLYMKPSLMFREDGSMYDFGTGHDRSVFTFGTAVAAMAVVSSFVFAMGDLLAPPPGAPPPAAAARPRAVPLRSFAARGPDAGFAGGDDPFDLRGSVF